MYAQNTKIKWTDPAKRENKVDRPSKACDAIPAQSDLDKVAEWVKECEGSPHLTWVEATLPASHAVRINITIQEDILKALDRKLAGHKNKRSGFIAQAVERQLQEA